MAVRVPVVADFDGSGVKEAQAAFANFGQSVSRTLQQAGRTARRDLKTLADGLDEGATASDRLVAAIRKTGQELDTQLRQSRDAADALGQALGPELAARLGQSGIEKLVVDLRRAGATLDDITADADKFAAAIREVDDVNLRNVRGELDDVNAATRRVGDSADRTGSVFANFTGNAAQEIPGIGGAFGPLNVALGQFVEYATEGGIGLQKLAGAAAGIGAVTVAFTVINKQLKDLQANAELRRDRVDAFFDGFSDGLSKVDAARRAIEQVSQIRVASGGVAGFLGGSEFKDLEPILFRVRKRYYELADAIAAGPPAINRLVEGLRDQGAAADDVAAVEQFLYNSLEASTEAMVRQRQQLFLLALDEESLKAATSGLSGAYREELIPQFQAAVEETDRQREALLNLRDEQLKNLNAQFRLEEATDDARTAVEEYNRSRSKTDYRKARQEVLDVAAATAELTAETSRLTDPAEREAEAVLAQVRALEEYAATIAPGSKLRTDVLSWATYLKQSIPPELVTELRVRISDTALKALALYGGAAGVGGTSGLFAGGLPSITSNAATAAAINQRQQVVNNYQITVTGPIDREGAAAEIRRILNDSAQRNGTGAVYD